MLRTNFSNTLKDSLRVIDRHFLLETFSFLWNETRFVEKIYFYWNNKKNHMKYQRKECNIEKKRIRADMMAFRAEDRRICDRRTERFHHQHVRFFVIRKLWRIQSISSSNTRRAQWKHFFLSPFIDNVWSSPSACSRRLKPHKWRLVSKLIFHQY